MRGFNLSGFRSSHGLYFKKKKILKFQALETIISGENLALQLRTTRTKA